METLLLWSTFFLISSRVSLSESYLTGYRVDDEVDPDLQDPVESVEHTPQLLVPPGLVPPSSLKNAVASGAKLDIGISGFRTRRGY